MQRLVILTVVSVVACTVDPVGNAEPILSCQGDCALDQGLHVRGTVRIGAHTPLADEAEVLFFTPSDTLSPRLTLKVRGGGSYEHFWSNPWVAEACSYLVRARLWSGATSPLQPLLSSAAECRVSWRWDEVRGPTLRLPGYPPLQRPMVIWGRVLLDDRPAQPQETIVVPGLRIPLDGSATSITTDANGVWRAETTDGAQPFALCRHASARVSASAGGHDWTTSLDTPSDLACPTERQLPEVRIGSREAARGRVYLGAGEYPNEPPPAGFGEVALSLASPADSSLVGETFHTYDDGSFRLWFPYPMQDPGCDWLLRAESADVVQFWSLLPDSISTCDAGIRRDLELTGG